jgi:hypothetical protein
MPRKSFGYPPIFPTLGADVPCLDATRAAQIFSQLTTTYKVCGRIVLIEMTKPRSEILIPSIEPECPSALRSSP